MKQWLMTLLSGLEVALEPAPGAHHAITYASYGSDKTGWENKLALHLMLPGENVTLFLDDSDFSSSPESVVAEIVRLNHARLCP